MTIEFTPKESTGVDRHVQVSVPVETVKDAEEKAARRYASSVRLPGFRPGKAPAAMVRKKFAEQIRQEALESLVRDAYKEVVEKQDLKVASQPHVHDLSFEDGKPLTFELHFELRPTIELARTSGFRVTGRKPTVTDEQVVEQLEQIRDQRAAWAPVEDKPLPGDMVNVQLSTGDKIESAGDEKAYPLVLGAGQAIPGIEELIMEATPGQTVQRPVRWPDDFPDETQRGQTKTVRITLNEVKRKTAPALDDAFAREVGDF
ncbi:MAG: trigger factor, partial [Gemmatimonadaceae bacterium]